MLKVDCTYEHTGKKVHHVGAEMNFVPPQMGPSLRLAMGRDPGEQENIEMKPFVGPAGKFFDSLLRKAGVDRGQLTVLNTLQCRPPNNIHPQDGKARFYISEVEADKAVAQCWKNHVQPVLESRPWTRIDALGGEALVLLSGKKGGIHKWRGSPLALKGEIKERIIPTLHPSYIMQYGQGYIPVVISDLKKGTNVPPEFYNLRPTLDDLAAFRSSTLCFDIETNIFTRQITMVGICDRPYHVMVVPFRGAYIAELRRIFASATNVIGHNIISFDLPELKIAGIEVNQECQIWDTILMQHLIQPDCPHDLEFVSSVFTQKPAWKHLEGENKELYCARDVDVTYQIWQQVLPVLKQQNLLDLYKYTQIPLAKICALIERGPGIRTSGKAATKARLDLLKEIGEKELLLPDELKPYDKPVRVRQLAPPGTVGKSGKPVKYTHIPDVERVVPWRSPDSIKKYLYQTLGLPEQFNPKTKKVTSDKTALEKLYNRTKNPSIQALRKLGSLDELASSFLKGLKDEDGNEIPVKDGKISPHLSPYGTSQGRLSSSGPNMQNQPPQARCIYVPSDPEWCFVEADFSQGENRLTAWYADDRERLVRLSAPGFSEHKLNAQIFFDIPYDQVVKDNSPDAPYGRAKKLTHGINFGEGYRKIALSLDLPEKDVRDWLYKWRVVNVPTVRWQERTSKQAEVEGVLTNVFGRKRWFWSNRLYGESLSMLPQSTLADICFRAMIGLMYERIGWSAELALKVSSVLAPLPYPARLLLQVHDSLLVECPRAQVPDVVKCLRAVMEQGWTQMGGFNVPVEFSVGDPGASWGELKSYKLEEYEA
jgi:uracil-DNA glycosylase family 4